MQNTQWVLAPVPPFENDRVLGAWGCRSMLAMIIYKLKCEAHSQPSACAVYKGRAFQCSSGVEVSSPQQRGLWSLRVLEHAMAPQPLYHVSNWFIWSVGREQALAFCRGFEGAVTNSHTAISHPNVRSFTSYACRTALEDQPFLMGKPELRGVIRWPWRAFFWNAHFQQLARSVGSSSPQACTWSAQPAGKP